MPFDFIVLLPLVRKFDLIITIFIGEMSSYDNVVGGKLKLKGKALDVKAGGVKKKKKQKKQYDQISQAVDGELSFNGGDVVCPLLFMIRIQHCCFPLILMFS